MNRRLLYGALIVVATSLLVGAGSFSTITADQGVDVDIAGDTSAYLGIEDRDPGQAIEDGPSVTVLALDDNFPADASVESATAPDGAPVSVTSATLGGDVRVQCTRETNGDTAVDLSLVAGSAGTTVRTTETVSIACLPKIAPEDVTFDSKCRNVTISTVSERYPIDIVLERSQETDVTATLDGSNDKAGIDSGTLTAVVVEDTAERFQNQRECPGDGSQ
jgi:hypothetical protein